MTKPKLSPSTSQPAALPPTPAARLFTSEALRRAWLAVKRTGGGAGVDGITLAKFEANLPAELSQLQQQLISGAYQPRPLRRILIPKADGGLRPLALWALRDRIAQRTVYDMLAPLFEPRFLPCSFGFRTGLGVAAAIQQLQCYRDQNRLWVVDADIAHCFDSIATDRLLPLIAAVVQEPLLLTYLERWLAARILNSADGVPEVAGASQGSVLSPLLANIYLHQIDCVLTAQQVALLRYADDLLICCRRKGEAEAALALVGRVLGDWQLQLSPRKTGIRHFDQGFAWLGYFFIRRECYRL